MSPRINYAWAVVFALGALVFHSTNALAVGEAGAQFLRIPLGTKAAAMGEASVAISDDPSAVNSNPAGLAHLHDRQLLGMHASWLEDMGCEYFATTTPTRHGNLGFSLLYSSSGDIPGRDVNRNETGDFTAYDASAALAYGRAFGRHIACGVTLKSIHQKIEEETARGWACDFGLQVRDLGISGLNAGITLQNAGPSIKFIESADPLPLVVRGGLSLAGDAYLVTAEVSKPRHSEPQIHLGGELMLRRVLALRAGFLTRPEMGGVPTAGLGLFWHQMAFEYAFVPHDELSDTHRIAIQAAF